MQPNLKPSRSRWSYGPSHVVLVGLTLSLAAVACGVPMETEEAARMGRMGQANHMGAASAGDATAPADDVEAPEASTADDAPMGDAAKGKANFAACAACHGPDGKGVPSLGKNLVTSTFAKDMTDAELVAFLKVGRDTSDPLNTTGVAMPPKGGNPALTDGDLMDIVAYVRQLEAAP